MEDKQIAPGVFQNEADINDNMAFDEARDTETEDAIEEERREQNHDHFQEALHD